MAQAKPSRSYFGGPLMHTHPDGSESHGWLAADHAKAKACPICREHRLAICHHKEA